MFTRKQKIKMDNAEDVYNIVPLGDIHYGNKAIDLPSFKDALAKIQNTPNTFVLGMGDYIDNITAYASGSVDKRWNPETVDRKVLTTEEQIAGFIKLWKPIAHKTLGLLAGNHEWKTVNQARFINDICKPLGVAYLGRSCFVHLIFTLDGKVVRTYTIHAFHGGYGGERAGNILNRMEDTAAKFEADIYLMGHSHDLVKHKSLRTAFDPLTDNIVNRPFLCANTGTFLETYREGLDGYTEINPKASKRIGHQTIVLKPTDGGIFSYD